MIHRGRIKKEDSSRARTMEVFLRDFAIHFLVLTSHLLLCAEQRSISEVVRRTNEHVMK